jgi:murein DD-endopeptidase MepM/ murein hydrolase activator NlpD
MVLEKYLVCLKAKIILMRKSLPIIVIITIFILSSCNFPLKFSSNPMDEIPFPTNSTTTQTITQPTPGVTLQIDLQEPLFLENGAFHYSAQSGDTLEVVARHFGVSPLQISSFQAIDPLGVINPGQVLLIPDVLGTSFTSKNIMPDSEVIYSPSAGDFDVIDYVRNAGGYLSIFHQMVNGEDLTGAEIVKRLAVSTSVNPRLLLAVIEYRSHWVTRIPDEINATYPLGFYYQDHQGFYLECALAAKWINMGYYGWRQGLFTELTFSNGSSIRVEPQLNAGTVALQYFFSQFSQEGDWQYELYGNNGLVSLHQSMFGDPWSRAASIEPLFTSGTAQPQLELPFTAGEEWALTGGLHYDWNSGTPMGALDFAPITGERPCVVSRAWVLAPAPGKIIYSDNSIVILDIYNGSSESTGWQLFFMHISAQERVSEGTYVNRDDHIGHPSCEGGQATGTHVHIARRFKGEWLASGSPFPFILSGWTALPGTTQFQSTLVKDGHVVISRQDGSIDSRITR